MCKEDKLTNTHVLNFYALNMKAIVSGSAI